MFIELRFKRSQTRQDGEISTLTLFEKSFDSIQIHLTNEVLKQSTNRYKAIQRKMSGRFKGLSIVLHCCRIELEQQWLLNV